MTFLAVVGRDPESVRNATRDILDRPEFEQNQSLWERVRGWLSDPLSAIGDAFDWLMGRFTGDSGVDAAVAWALALVLAAAVVYFVFRLVRTTPMGATVVEPKQKTQRERDTELLADAERFEQQGDWRQAIRCRHAALLVVLSRKGALRRRPGVTAREYVYEFADSTPAAADDFEEATTLFERAWYGPAEPERSDSERFRELATRVKRKAAA